MEQELLLKITTGYSMPILVTNAIVAREKYAWMKVEVFETTCNYLNLVVMGFSSRNDYILTIQKALKWTLLSIHGVALKDIEFIHVRCFFSKILIVLRSRTQKKKSKRGTSYTYYGPYLTKLSKFSIYVFVSKSIYSYGALNHNYQINLLLRTELVVNIIKFSNHDNIKNIAMSINASRSSCRSPP